MSANPLISVILPVFNMQAFLPRCMETLLKQTYTNLEFVLVDDGSGEECARLCDSYSELDERIKVYHKLNGGLSDARNYGLQQAGGEYISFADPDDCADTDYIAYLFQLIQDYRTPMAICMHRVVFADGRVNDYGGEGSEVLDSKTCLERMLYHERIDTSACMKLYHRSLFEGVNYPKGKQFEDIGTTYQLILRSGKVAVGYASKYSYFMRGDSITNCAYNPHKLDLLEMTDRMAADVVSVYPDLADAALRRRVYARFSTLNQLLETDLDDLKQEQIQFIKKYRKELLLRKRTPKRDKAAILFLMFGLKSYSLMWKYYQKLLAGKLF